MDRNMHSASFPTELKVVFLGDKGAGKSHTIARLIKGGTKPNCYNDVPTSGIVIQSHEYPIDGRNAKVHFWEFGGHEALRPFNRLFITGRTVYVVMLNAVSDSLDERAGYWLHTIRSVAADAPVLLVLNHMDKTREPQIRPKALRHSFDNLKEVCYLSALEDNEAQFNLAFADKLRVQLRELDLHGMWCRRTSAMQIRDELSKMGNGFLRGSDYARICEEYGCPDENMTLLQQFRDQGVIFFRHRRQDQDDCLICRNEWLLEKLGLLLDRERNISVSGVLSHAMIQQIMAPIEPPQLETILDIFRDSRLSASAGDDMEFIPALCPDSFQQTAAVYEGPSDMLEMRLIYKYMPCDVIQLLMLELWDELVLNHVFSSAVRFHQRDTDINASVRLRGGENRDSEIQICAWSTDSRYQPNSYLGRIRTALVRIGTELGLRQPETMAVYKAHDGQATFHIDRLVGMLNDRNSVVYSGELRRPVPIHDILSQTDLVDWKTDQSLDTILFDISSICIRIRTASRRQTISAQFRNTYFEQLLCGSGHRIRSADGLLTICKEDAQPWIACSGLSISHCGQQHTELWDGQLARRLSESAEVGLRDMILITYIDSDTEDFEDFWQLYRGHILRCDPPGALRREETYMEAIVPRADPCLQRTARHIYDVGGTPVTVYYYFVWMGDLGPGRGRQSTQSSPTVQERQSAVPKRQPAAEKQLVAQKCSTDAPNRVSAGRVPIIVRSADGLSPDQFPQREYRVVFLGDSEAGKTLTITRLVKPDMDPKTFPGEATSGIEIQRVIYGIDGREILVNFWDFGGQEILYSMHRMFLTDHTLYVVLLNTRQDSQDERAQFWLRYLRTYAKNSPILLVLNKVDQNDGASVNEAHLRRLNPMLKKILRLSALMYTQKEFYDALTKPLVEQICADDDGQYFFSEKEKAVRDEIRRSSEKKKRLRLEEFRNICEENGLERAEQDMLISRFHNAGVFVYFGDALETLPFALLEPKWITGAIYELLKAHRGDSENGILSHKEILTILSQGLGYKCTENDVSYVLGVMREHNLSYELPNSRKEFIPMLCRRQEPDAAARIIQNPNAAQMHIHFEYLPAGVLFQLIVVRKDDLEPDNVWLTGAVFRSEGCRALVLRQGDTLSIYCLGDQQPQVSAYMTVLLDAIKASAKDPAHAATIREQKIGFRIGDEMEYFDYDRLQTAKNCREEHVISKKYEGRVSIQDILDLTDRSIYLATKKLLKDIAVACTQLMEGVTFIDAKEDSRNSYLRNALMNRNHSVQDQTLIGRAPSGNRANELDLLHRIADGQPNTIIEGLNVTKRIAMAKWNDHLERLLGRYDCWGLNTLVLVSYVDCSKEDCSGLFQKYDDHMKTYQPKAASLIQDSHAPYAPLLQEYAYFYAASCNYLREEKKVTVYHYFVRIDKEAPDSGK